MYDGGAWRRLCTKYEVRCTIVIIARVARGSRASAEECDGTCTRVVRKRREAVALGGAYVRSMTYDVRLPNSRALRGEAEQVRKNVMEHARGWLESGGRRRRLAAPGGRRGLPMYDGRRTMYDCKACARSAEERWQMGSAYVRCTMYDLNASAPEAREFCEAGAEGWTS